ncbi:hypothetical protein Q5H91_06290 [Sphingomonas sp. KR1UV-12]|uniref:Uncharacterized protein n=1 Tax=Sphingomonas aurea TaxID=3063994 RepID=A0ABT9EJJ3_9SPHN|nr:hypothetical protein [Sphingomonas sp. KR1UV-12]MDP1026813.1 hypothetical protein [Sphingomonas sp. KR1UV-12]
MFRVTVARSTLAVVLLGLTIAAQAAKPPQTSWGRAGVSFDQYRADAIGCGRLGANADIADQPATKAFVAAENWNERNLNVPQAGVDPAREQAQMIHRLRPAERIAEVQGVHVSVTERCLMRLGYRQFALTAEQAKALCRLRVGTSARHAFLYDLASDPAVLARQAVGPKSHKG